jgi:hypothetical protein
MDSRELSDNLKQVLNSRRRAPLRARRAAAELEAAASQDLGMRIEREECARPHPRDTSTPHAD